MEISRRMKASWSRRRKAAALVVEGVNEQARIAGTNTTTTDVTVTVTVTENELGALINALRENVHGTVTIAL